MSAAPDDMDVFGDLVGNERPVHRCHKELEHGEACGCGYRKPFPKTEDAPESGVKSFRGPTDELDDFNENLYVACQIVGLTSKTKYAPFKLFDWLLAEIIANPEKYQGAFLEYRKAA